MLEEEKSPSGRTAELCLPPRLMKPRLRRDEAVEYLLLKHGIPVAFKTLCKWVTTGGPKDIGAPPYQKSGPTPLYPVVELDAWAAKRLGHLRRSSSDDGMAA